MIILRLSARALMRGHSVARMLACQSTLPWRQAYRLLPSFEMAPYELRFARRLQVARPNIWLFRCHQQRQCGDFALVDMSPRHAARRRVIFVELKLSGRLRCAEGPMGQQTRRLHSAALEIERRYRAVQAGRVGVLEGGVEALCARLGV